MRSHVRIALVTLLAGAAVASAPAAAQASFGIEKFVAVNCDVGHEPCAQQTVGPYSEPKEPTKAEAEESGFTQAGGHVPYGITDFKVNTEGTYPNEKPSGLAEGGVITHIRTDVASGLATSPAAVPQCTMAEFGTEVLPGFYTAPACKPESKIGLNKATVYAGAAGDLPLEGGVYNLVQREPKGTEPGLASEFGVALELPKPFTEAVLHEKLKGTPYEGNAAIEKGQYFAHTLIEGSVEWGKEAAGTGAGDYHDYFNIKVSPELPLLASRLVFYGRSGEGDFITNATSCPGDNTTRLTITSAAEHTSVREYTTPVPLSGCGLLPFEPSFALTPATTQHDTPDGFSATLALPRHPGATEIDSSELKIAEFTLPEGMTLNPSAAAGLTACTPAQARIHSELAGTECPASSEVGTVALNVPTLPNGSLTGKVYLGGPEGGGPITAPPYVMYVDAESVRYHVSVRLEGKVIPNEATGQLTTVFRENPEQPFTNITLHFKEGALAPVANPLSCGTVRAGTALAPYSLGPVKIPASNPFTFDLNGAGGACATPPPFTPSQSTALQNPTAGAHTAFTFNLERADGNQYVSEVKTTLPEGLVGAIPAATQCAEPGASKGECPSTSQLGVATVLAGSGATPYTFSGPVYLTGPYNGAPFGLSIPVPAVAGPFNLGIVTTRATINVDPYTARVVIDSVLPRIVKGVPLRLKKISVLVDKQGFLSNPTNCSTLATESAISGFTPETGATAAAALSTPFAVANCTALPFKPSFKAATSSRWNRSGGASLETTINQPAGGANIKSVTVQLPLQLPSRQATFSKACLAAVFAANPYSCGAAIGGVRANTPLLPSKMTGPVYFVARGGAQFPDLDLVLNANGVRVIVVGETKITKGITTTHFAAPPDVPVSSITVNLPMGRLSALAGYGSFCRSPLYMPTTIEGQNGKLFKQNTKIRVTGCGVQVVGHKVIGNTAYLTVRTFAPGRVSGNGGRGTVFRHFGTAVGTATLKVPLRGGRHIRIRVGFLPSNRSLAASAAFVTVR